MITVIAAAAGVLGLAEVYRVFGAPDNEFTLYLSLTAVLEVVALVASPGPARGWHLLSNRGVVVLADGSQRPRSHRVRPLPGPPDRPAARPPGLQAGTSPAAAWPARAQPTAQTSRSRRTPPPAQSPPSGRFADAARPTAYGPLPDPASQTGRRAHLAESGPRK